MTVLALPQCGRCGRRLVRGLCPNASCLGDTNTGCGLNLDEVETALMEGRG